MQRLPRTSGITIPYDYPHIQQIMMDLDRFVTGYNGESTRMVFYEKVPGGIMVPRYYKVPGCMLPDCVIEDLSSEGDDIDIESKIKPRNDRQVKSMDFLQRNNCGVLKLEPGTGKTVLSIDTICKVGKRAIVFVHKKKLREQWTEEILEHTNVSIDDVAWLSKETYKKDFSKPVIVATVQGICSYLKNIPEFKEALMKSGIGLAIFDEAHTTVGPEQFSKASMSLPCRRVYGLSATPYRNDGNDDIITSHLGEIQYFEPEKDELLKPIVFMIYFPFGVYKASKRYLTYGGGFSTSRYYQQLYKSPKYIDRVSRIIDKLYMQDRTLLVLGVRITSLLTIAQSDQVSREDTGIFIPTAVTKKEHKKTIEIVSDNMDLTVAFKEKKVVYSTYNAARDGNNRKALDTLIMTVPTGNVEQAAGRVLRVLEGKKQPYVIDLIDTEGPTVKYYPTGQMVPWWVKSALYRKELYQEKGWEIREHKYHD